jgi:integrase
LVLVSQRQPLESPALKVGIDSLDSPVSRTGTAHRLRMALRLWKEDENIYAYPWHDLTYAQVASLRAIARDYEWKPADAKGKHVWAAATVNGTLEAVKCICRAAYNLRLMTGDEWTRINNIKSVKGTSQRRGRMLSTSDRDAIPATLKARAVCTGVSTYQRQLAARNQAIIAVMLGWGLRTREVVELPFQDYNATKTIIRGKGNKERTVYPQPHHIAAIDAWLIIRGTAPGRLFTQLRCDKLGRPLDVSAVRSICEAVAKAAGIKNWAPHDTRRTFASVGLTLIGNDLVKMGKRLGHASITTTARYDMRAEEDDEAVAKVLGDAGL